MMCSRLLQKMENFQGDLTDILRAGNSVAAPPAEQGVIMNIPDEWQFPDKDLLEPILVHDQESLDEFGDPFSSLRDPLLLHHHPSSAFFTSNTPAAPLPSSSSFGNTNIISDEEGPPPQSCKSSNAGNMFSTMLQISPSTAKFPISAPPISSPVLAVNESVNKKAVESGGPASQQISSPRPTGMKRRKSQAKKVVCIPAPAPANSRPSGEIVPSDLWAWRKYGQKPIKGSPYPRGYYRCSSSKGCSARKQVERSRTDPNMLVITYTSEHNHPWPTQRNALAGSTRNPPTKTAASTSKPPPAAVKEEAPAMKEEMQSYRPALPDSNHTEDFFADLGELEADPLSLLFAKGGYGNGESGHQEEQKDKSMDSFSFYDWVNSTTSDVVAGGHNKGL